MYCPPASILVMLLVSLVVGCAGDDMRNSGGDSKHQKQTLVVAAPQYGFTYNYGNDLAWLHYMWVNVGTQKNCFLVALDTTSDMFWLPCDHCTSCAPLNLSQYGVLDKDLPRYSPWQSDTTSKALPCSHELCDKASLCDFPKGQCPYESKKYLYDNTSSSGFLFEDVLQLATVEDNEHKASFINASVIIGCGSKQTDNYLYVLAPNGVMGLGPGDISVPSVLAKSGVIPARSYSFCYDKSYKGRLYFGDQGPASQRSTSFFPSKQNGNNMYLVEVDHCCVGSLCLNQSGFKAQVDTSASFTYLPGDVYQQLVSEFDKQVNATRASKESFEHCYEDDSSLNIASNISLNIPNLKLVFPMHQSFVIENPVIVLADNLGGFRCLGVHRAPGDIGIIGQNFLMGYRMVFDWDKMKLGWSISNCHDIKGNYEKSDAARELHSLLSLFLWTMYVIINYIHL